MSITVNGEGVVVRGWGLSGGMRGGGGGGRDKRVWRW